MLSLWRSFYMFVHCEIIKKCIKVWNVKTKRDIVFYIFFLFFYSQIILTSRQTNSKIMRTVMKTVLAVTTLAMKERRVKTNHLAIIWNRNEPITLKYQNHKIFLKITTKFKIFIKITEKIRRQKKEGKGEKLWTWWMELQLSI